MKIHELKCQPPHYGAIEAGTKKYELRKNDRDYAEGDYLILRLYYADTGYSYPFTIRKVTYLVTEFPGLEKGYCAMGIEAVTDDEYKEVLDQWQGCKDANSPFNARTTSLALLQADTNNILNGLDKKQIEGAINWADLSCTEARLVITGDGKAHWQVIIEEASPEANNLKAEVSDQLSNLHWTPYVEVLTEW